MDISNGKSIFEVKGTIAINKVTILKNKATIALLFDSRATKTKAAIRICQSFLGTFSIMPPPPHFAAKSHFYGCTVTLPVTSSTAYCRRLSSLMIEASKTSGPGCSNVVWRYPPVDHYPAKRILWIEIYPVDSVLYLLNKWALMKCDWCRIVRTTEGKLKESLVMSGIQNQKLSSEVGM